MAVTISYAFFPYCPEALMDPVVIRGHLYHHNRTFVFPFLYRAAQKYVTALLFEDAFKRGTFLFPYRLWFFEFSVHVFLD